MSGDGKAYCKHIYGSYESIEAIIIMHIVLIKVESITEHWDVFLCFGMVNILVLSRKYA